MQDDVAAKHTLDFIVADSHDLRDEESHDADGQSADDRLRPERLRRQPGESLAKKQEQPDERHRRKAPDYAKQRVDDEL